MHHLRQSCLVSRFFLSLFTDTDYSAVDVTLVGLGLSGPERSRHFQAFPRVCRLLPLLFSSIHVNTCFVAGCRHRATHTHGLYVEILLCTKSRYVLVKDIVVC